MDSEGLLAGFATIASAPGGVGRLRELVLELAVRGALVSQDRRDEPAETLLETIGGLRQQAIEDGVFRKQRPIPRVEPTVSHSLPHGWAWTCLAALGAIGPRNECGVAVGAAFLPMPSIPTDYRQAATIETRSWGEIRKGFTHVADGDLAVAKITPCFQNRKSCVLEHLPNGIGAGTTELLVLRPVPKSIETRYLLLFVKSPAFIEGGLARMTGTAGQQRVPREYFAYSPVPLPPLAEQRRIVAKVDELMALCDELEARQERRHTVRRAAQTSALEALSAADTSDALARAWDRVRANWEALTAHSDSIPPLRQAVLQLAVQGKLVRQAPEDEPASRMLTAASSEGDRRARSLLEAVGAEETPFPPPGGWAWARFAAIADIAGGVTKGRKLAGRELIQVPYLRVANVQAGYLDLKQIKEIEIPIDELDRYELRSGDVLLTEGGDWDKLGRSAVWQGEIAPCIHQNHVFRARPRSGDLQSVWLSRYTNSPLGRAYFQSCAKQTTNLASINMTQLRACPVPIPPAREQVRILKRVDQLMALCDDLEARLQSQETTSTQLAAAAVPHPGVLNTAAD